MTTCNIAIKAWEAKNEAVAADATAVKLYCQVPPIQKMDNSLNTLENCEHLSLSTNSIDRLIPLAGMKRLTILSMGRNGLKKIEKLDDVAETLQQLWVSYNSISSLDGLAGLTGLEVLYISNNNIHDPSEIGKLAGLTSLRDVLFIGNPMYAGLSVEDQRILVLKHLPDIAKIDGDMVKPSEREAAAAALAAEG